MEKKNVVTKKMILNAIMAVANTMDFGTEVTVDDVMNYCATTIAQLDAKNEKAKIRSAEKRKEADVLVDVIASVLTDEPQTINQIVAQIEGDTEVTPAMISSRAKKLIDAGTAEKVSVKVDGRTVVAYKKA